MNIHLALWQLVALKVLDLVVMLLIGSAVVLGSRGPGDLRDRTVQVVLVLCMLAAVLGMAGLFVVGGWFLFQALPHA